MKALQLFFVLWFACQGYCRELETLKYSINGRDFYNNFMVKSKPLLVREACRLWPLHQQIDTGNIDGDFASMEIVAWPVSTPEYGDEKYTMKEFMDIVQYGKTFKKNLTDDASESLLTSIEVPLMIASCRDLLDDFSKSLELLMIGAKISEEEEDISMAKIQCMKTHTFLAVMSGQIGIRRVSNDVSDTIEVDAGDLLYLPPKTCYRIFYRSLSIGFLMSWSESDRDELNCNERTLYTKDPGYDSRIPVSEDKEAKPQTLRSGYTMPPIGLGTSRLFHKTYDSVLRALEIGYRLIDTAQMYNGTDTTSSEEEIGRALKDSPVARNDVFLVTKLDPEAFKPTRENTLQSIEKSMKSFQTDYLDLVLIHDPYDQGKCDEDEDGCKLNFWESWEALEDLHAQGKIRSLGISNIETVEDLNTIEERVKVPVSVVENWFDPFHQDLEIRKYCKQHGIVYIGYSTLGLLWIDKERGLGMDYNPVLYHPTIKRMALATDLPPATAILRWAMHNHVIVIPCTANPDHMETNFYSRQMSIKKNMINMINELDNTFGYGHIGMTMEEFNEKYSMVHANFIKKFYAASPQDEENKDEEEDDVTGGGLPDFEMGSVKDEL